MYKIGIVGLGPAGILALGLIMRRMDKDIIVFEPDVVGGHLITRYSTVVANIPTSKIIEAFRSVEDWEHLPMPRLDKYGSEECPKLLEAALQLRELIAPSLERVRIVKDRATQFERLSNSWAVKTRGGEVFEVQKLILCVGAEPRGLPLGKPQLPPQVGLDMRFLPLAVYRTEKVVVFGTSHSGTLILKNLFLMKCMNVIAVHKSNEPFVFERDGNPDGIKEESAAIADAILAGSWADATPTFIKLSDTAAVDAAVGAADHIIAAAGMDKPPLTYLERGVTRPLIHNGLRFVGPKDIYGFGIGFPTKYVAADGKSYSDVGFAPFVNAIKEALPSILEPYL
jgi:cation diffusion facilitator CzcD-associated flavoprotein CzcO